MPNGSLSTSAPCRSTVPAGIERTLGDCPTWGPSPQRWTNTATVLAGTLSVAVARSHQDVLTPPSAPAVWTGQSARPDAAQTGQLLVRRSRRAGEHHDHSLEGILDVGANRVVPPHHDHAPMGIHTPGYGEGELGVDGIRRTESEQGQGEAHLEQVRGLSRRRVHLRSRRLERRVGPGPEILGRHHSASRRAGTPNERRGDRCDLCSARRTCLQ